MSAKSKVISSHILKKSPIALTYSRIVEGVTESKRSFMFLTLKKTASYISEFDTVDHDMLNCQWAGTSDTYRHLVLITEMWCDEIENNDIPSTPQVGKALWDNDDLKDLRCFTIKQIVDRIKYFSKKSSCSTKKKSKGSEKHCCLTLTSCVVYIDMQ